MKKVHDIQHMNWKTALLYHLGYLLILLPLPGFVTIVTVVEVGVVAVVVVEVIVVVEDVTVVDKSGKQFIQQ